MDKKILKIKKDDTGDITDVMLSNGDIFSINDAIRMTKEGAIKGVEVEKGRNGAEFLKTQSIEGENISNLPTF